MRAETHTPPAEAKTPAMYHVRHAKDQTTCPCGRPLGEDVAWNEDKDAYECGVCWRRTQAATLEGLANDDLIKARKLRGEADRIESGGRVVEIAQQS